MDAQWIGVLGASGGVGASTTALGLAGRAAATGLRVACIDGQWFSGGLDVIAGLEDRAGLRWADLRQVRGRVDAQELVAELPVEAGVWLLSVDRARPSAIERDAAQPVVEALARVADVCVLDLPRWGMPLADELSGLVDDLVLVGGESAAALSATAALSRVLHSFPGRLWLAQRDVTNDPELGQTVAELTGMPLVAMLPDDRGVPNALAAGGWPGVGHGPLATACGSMLTQLRLQVVSV